MKRRGTPAAGIPDARLILYEGMGHPASGPRFRRDLRAFLLESGGDAGSDVTTTVAER